MKRGQLADKFRPGHGAVARCDLPQIRPRVEHIGSIYDQMSGRSHGVRPCGKSSANQYFRALYLYLINDSLERSGEFPSLHSSLAAQPALHCDKNMSPNLGRFIGLGIVIIVIVIAAAQATFVIEPGFRGVEVTLGKVSPQFKPEGFGTKAPFITHIVSIPIRQLTRELPSECYSSDLQQVNVTLRVLYRIPEASVVRIYKEFAGDPFEALIAPRIQEAVKEVTALQSAEQIVKKREDIKIKALAASREKVGPILILEDIVLEDITLSKELEAAIESKMVQEQEAAKARFTQQKTQIEADTAIIRAKGEAEAIRVRAEAIRDNPGLIQLQIVEKWDGKAPLVIGGSSEGSNGANILLPLGLPSAASRK